MKTEPLRSTRDEKFVRALVSGMSQHDAYLVAFPRSKGFASSTVDVKASILAHVTKISERIRDLLEEAAERTVCSLVERRQLLSDFARAKVDDCRVRDRVNSIDVLNKMDRIYQDQVKISAGDGLVELATAIASGLPTWTRRKTAKNNQH